MAIPVSYTHLDVYKRQDGMHIRLLMITFFLQFFPDLIKKGHVYILQMCIRDRNKDDVRTPYGSHSY